jgi:hypothetical protein
MTRLFSAICLAVVAWILLFEYTNSGTLAGHHDPWETKESRPTSNYCTSGNEYLSLERGGHWFNSSLVAETPNNNTMGDAKINVLCFLRGYKEMFEWSPSCDPLPNMAVAIKIMDGHDDGNGNDDTLLLPSQRIPRVRLLGDSLTKQIIISCNARINQPWNDARCVLNGIDYHKFFTRMTYMSSVPFKSVLAPQCSEQANANFSKHALINKTDEDFLSLIDGFDYVFFNHYAHFYNFKRAIAPCYKQHEVKTVDMMDELLDFHKAQLLKVSALMKGQADAVGTRFYYRTSPPHAYEWIPASQPLDEVPPLISHADCREKSDSYKVMWGCAATFNAIGVSAFEEYGHSVLDTAPAMSLRVDAHPCSFAMFGSEKDCLHFCVPGPADTMLEAMQAEVLARERDRHKRA